MKQKNKKGLIITLIILIITCILCGTVGFLESKKEDDPKDKDKNKNYKVTYMYYIDNEKVDELPEKEELKVINPDFEGAEDDTLVYQFEKAACTNIKTPNENGTWDDEEWEFTPPELTNNSTCRLYFLKSLHKVTVKASNGELPNKENEQEFDALINDETIVIVKPKEGYKYDSEIKATCTNGAKAEYDETTGDLKITDVTKDSTCTIPFKISDYTVEIEANFGTITGERSKTVNHGGNVEFEIKEAENYIYDDYTCTNDQKASFVNGKLTVREVTNNTKCTVTFKPKKLSVTLTIEGGKLDSGYSSPLEVSEGQTATFIVKANEGFSYSNMNVDCDGSTKGDYQSTGDSAIVKIYDVKTNAICKVTLKKVAD
ncbi:MAG: hypothetical protein HFE04_01750 [Bacilli bacterium]|nr:hypothetical protein [Bacilli bacterium]